MYRALMSWIMLIQTNKYLRPSSISVLLVFYDISKDRTLMTRIRLIYTDKNLRLSAKSVLSVFHKESKDRTLMTRINRRAKIYNHLQNKCCQCSIKNQRIERG